MRKKHLVGQLEKLANFRPFIIWLHKLPAIPLVPMVIFDTKPLYGSIWLAKCRNERIGCHISMVCISSLKNNPSRGPVACDVVDPMFDSCSSLEGSISDEMRAVYSCVYQNTKLNHPVFWESRNEPQPQMILAEIEGCISRLINPMNYKYIRYIYPYKLAKY